MESHAVFAISGCDRCSGALSDLSATLILLALRRHQNEALRNNSPLRALAMKITKSSTNRPRRMRPQSLRYQLDRRNALP
jgi:hypothetical protein